MEIDKLKEAKALEEAEAEAEAAAAAAGTVVAGERTATKPSKRKERRTSTVSETGRHMKQIIPITCIPNTGL